MSSNEAGPNSPEWQELQLPSSPSTCSATSVLDNMSDLSALSELDDEEEDYEIVHASDSENGLLGSDKAPLSLDPFDDSEDDLVRDEEQSDSQRTVRRRSRLATTNRIKLSYPYPDEGDCGLGAAENAKLVPPSPSLVSLPDSEVEGDATLETGLNSGQSTVQGSRVLSSLETVKGSEEQCDKVIENFKSEEQKEAHIDAKSKPKGFSIETYNKYIYLLTLCISLLSAVGHQYIHHYMAPASFTKALQNTTLAIETKSIMPLQVITSLSTVPNCSTKAIAVRESTSLAIVPVLTAEKDILDKIDQELPQRPLRKAKRVRTLPGKEIASDPIQLFGRMFHKCCHVPLLLGTGPAIPSVANASTRLVSLLQSAGIDLKQALGNASNTLLEETGKAYDEYSAYVQKRLEDLHEHARPLSRKARRKLVRHLRQAQHEAAKKYRQIRLQEADFVSKKIPKAKKGYRKALRNLHERQPVFKHGSTKPSKAVKHVAKYQREILHNAKRQHHKAMRDVRHKGKQLRKEAHILGMRARKLLKRRDKHV